MTTAADPDTVDQPPAGGAESLTDIIEWLFLVFERRLGLTTVLATVQECCRELDIDTDPAGLNRLERVAYERLTGLTVAGATGPVEGEPARIKPWSGPRPVDRSTIRSV